MFENVLKNFGFGCMRLPMNNGEVNLEEFQKMVDYFLENGFNYFDTATGYLNGLSELALKSCLTSKYPRDKYFFVNKLSPSFFETHDDLEPYFNKQLESCGVGYFDLYLMHAQNANLFKKYQAARAYEFALEKKALGKVKHFGISFHDTPEVLDNILTSYPEIEVVQLQFNYLDYENPNVQSKRCYEVCVKHNKKVIVMEPVKGGTLVNLTKAAQDILTSHTASDTTMISESVPSINCGMRGLSYVEVKVTGPNKDLHSGHYGGAVANPINVLCDMISSLIDKDGHITVKGFYDDVVVLSDEDRAKLSKAPFDMEEYKEFLDIKEVKGEEGYSTLERTGIRPCLDVNGIWGGYTGEGAKTVLPSVAHAKISMRLVPNQDSETITRLFSEHFKAIAPDYVKVEVIPHHGGNGFLIPISSPAYKAAERAMTEVYGIEPVPSRGGGSIPILADLQRILEIDPLLMGFGLERDTIHSPNESYLLKQLFAGMEAIALFYRYY